MNKHTHTEWLREGNTVYALNLQGSNRFVAQVQGGWANQGRVRTDDAEIEANARLIAAAPELLVALQIARNWIKTAGDGLDLVNKDTLALIDSVIAKATGESA